MNILEIKHLCKNFGNHSVIRGLDLSVPEHSVFGFVGQNGAGKTTTMKMILGLLKPDSGDIVVHGEKVSYGERKSNVSIGYLPDVPEFYGYMNPMEYLKLCGEIAGISNSKIKNRSEELISLVGLEKVNRRISGFSRGMKQRLGIAQALFNEPSLLICDEPTSALDPIGRKEILDILSAIKGKTTVIFSTHILSDVERICDHVALLHDGKLALCGTLSDIKKKHRHNGFVIEFAKADDAESFMDCEELKSPEITAKKDKNTITIKVLDIKKDGQFLIALLAKKKITPIKFEIMEPTLENLFMEAIQ
ncbi:ABC transporter ATP-binding protein [Acidilutibacter cellobiosedens]|jgi:ABC-2 type transport system ATP-binding protein|uniref:ABC transporter ATP-binding protein n=1 Tax=Acidilutibacter cellobiosedens TaxID=2507161 RepID=A0A410QAM2_9FIRM|nr:ABC transporter ATP-binding protein [Acidilutibacter cellobiosedens]MBE6082277.1 ATP-binding cassette domain-containing protein [Tissierellaceae bacterium]QAT61043.1 ABC transporter ATP-binding protein [Acidilutibacter cellobiosedens]